MKLQDKYGKIIFLQYKSILFLIDSVDKKIFPEAKKELEEILKRPELVNIPIAILGNKIDMAGAVNMEELKETLNYDEIVANETRPMEIFMVIVTIKFQVFKSFEMDFNKII